MKNEIFTKKSNHLEDLLKKKYSLLFNLNKNKNKSLKQHSLNITQVDQIDLLKKQFLSKNKINNENKRQTQKEKRLNQIYNKEKNKSQNNFRKKTNKVKIDYFLNNIKNISEKYSYNKEKKEEKINLDLLNISKINSKQNFIQRISSYKILLEKNNKKLNNNNFREVYSTNFPLANFHVKKNRSVDLLELNNKIKEYSFDKNLNNCRGGVLKKNLSINNINSRNYEKKYKRTFEDNFWDFNYEHSRNIFIDNKVNLFKTRLDLFGIN